MNEIETGGSNPPNKSRAADVARQRARDKAALDAFARWIILDCGDPAPKFKNWQEMLEWIRENFGKEGAE
jgi:hypothetical protein